jgi:phosphopantetheinyl transferase (holo-ACP synthase)
MIIGLGSDLCNIERIANSLDRFGGHAEAANAVNTPYLHIIQVWCMPSA